MPLRDDLLDEIRRALSGTTTAGLTSPGATNDVFEAWIFTLAVKAAERCGATVAFEDIYDQPTSSLLFRTSPGRIYSSLPGGPAYVHAILNFPAAAPLEVHQGIYVAGLSRLPHECDVVVLHRSEAQTCRVEKVNPRHSRAVLVMECKCYSSGLGIDLARGFIGLTADLQSKGRYFVANTRSNRVETLLTRHNRHWGTGVVPSNTTEVVRLRAAFETELKKHLASA